MRLDIAFSRAAATDAGMEFTNLRNADDLSIARELLEWLFCTAEYCGDEHLAWLLKEEPCIRVPFSDHYVNDGGAGENIIVRANKWGHVHAPLTTWLKKHDITWTEF
jgi:hypothetical protein